MSQLSQNATALSFQIGINQGETGNFIGEIIVQIHDFKPELPNLQDFVIL